MHLHRVFLNGACALFLLCAATVITLPAQTFTTLHSFDYTDGARPYAGLVQATNGHLYGTTYGGGANDTCGNVPFTGCGTVFEIAPGGTVTTLYDFCSQSNCADGDQPFAALFQATNGNLYGTTNDGGANGYGTVFKITPSGTMRMLYSFCSQGPDPKGRCADGSGPLFAALVQATDGNLYGTTPEGGAFCCGEIFQITPGGTLTTLYSFCSQSGCTDGANPEAALVQGTDGSFYGTACCGGPNTCIIAGRNYECGTVFKITPSGTLTTLYSFCSQSGCTDGAIPDAALVQATDGNFYGTTAAGGANGYGTVFKITPSGTLTTLYSFCSLSGCTDGETPRAALVQGTDGNLYGTTMNGGGGDGGTVFKITPDGTLTTLYSFCSESHCTDGKNPFAGLVQANNGSFYGTTIIGGASSACEGGCGTVFSLSLGLGSFVETQLDTKVAFWGGFLFGGGR